MEIEFHTHKWWRERAVDHVSVMGVVADAGLGRMENNQPIQKLTKRSGAFLSFNI